jgi:hypothetical protein
VFGVFFWFLLVRVGYCSATVLLGFCLRLGGVCGCG